VPNIEKHKPKDPALGARGEKRINQASDALAVVIVIAGKVQV